MKKQYSQPLVEVIGTTPLSALCTSDVENIGGGGDPWQDGRMPQRPAMPPF